MKNLQGNELNMRNLIWIVVLLTVGFRVASAMDGKTLAHIISVPLIEGAGIYSAVNMIQSDNSNSKAAGITSVSLLGLNAGLGAFTMFGNAENYSSFRLVHRILGFAVTGAGLWMTISAATDDNIKSHVPYVAGGYTALTVVPLVIFRF